MMTPILMSSPSFLAGPHPTPAKLSPATPTAIDKRLLFMRCHSLFEAAKFVKKTDSPLARWCAVGLARQFPRSPVHSRLDSADSQHEEKAMFRCFRTTFDSAKTRPPPCRHSLG